MIDFAKLKTLNKSRIKVELDRNADQYPGLATIDPDKMTKSQMIANAQAMIAKTAPVPAKPLAVPAAVGLLTDVDKISAFKDLIENQPEAVIVPATQAIFRIRHPRQQGEIFELSVIPPDDDTSFNELTPHDLRRRWRTPEDTAHLARQKAHIAGTSLEDVPSWAVVPVYDYIQEGSLRLFKSNEAAQSANDQSDTDSQVGTLLDDLIGDTKMKLVYIEGAGLADEHMPMTIEPRGEYKRAEQQAAWNVLNGTIQGEGPLPANLDNVSHDPRHLTPVEVEYTRTRLQRCLDNPTPWSKTKVTGGFEQRLFFNQLLELEFRGFTPVRPGSNNKSGGFRPEIFQLIRQFAMEQGFDVYGDYVAPRAEREIKSDLLPTVPIR